MNGLPSLIAPNQQARPHSAPGVLGATQGQASQRAQRRRQLLENIQPQNVQSSTSSRSSGNPFLSSHGGESSLRRTSSSDRLGDLFPAFAGLPSREDSGSFSSHSSWNNSGRSTTDTTETVRLNSVESLRAVSDRAIPDRAVSAPY